MKYNKLRPYVSMIVNVISNMILVQYIGIYGIVVSTVLSFLISVPWSNYVLFKYLFKKSSFINLLVMLKGFVITALAGTMTFAACYYCGEGILGLIIRIAICCVLPNAVFAICFFRNAEFKYMLKTLKGFIKIKR